MDSVRFFYSTDGTDVHGPVTQGVLRQLVQDHVIGAASFLCREGETEWKPLDLEAYQVPLTKTSTLPPTPPPFLPSAAPEFQLNRPAAAITSPGNRLLAGILYSAAGIVALAGALISAFLTTPPNANSSQSEAIGYYLGSFAGSLFLIVLVPYAISLLFKGDIRIFVRALGMIGLALLSVVGHLANPDLTLLAHANAMSEKMKEQARKQIAANGYFQDNSAQAEQNLQTLQKEASGTTDTDRGIRDLLSVMNDLFAKVKVSNAAEEACDFQVSTIASPDDIAKRRALIVKLHDTQQDVLAYLQGFDAHCRDAMAKDNFPPDFVSGAISGARKTGHLDTLIALWQAKMKLSDDFVARLDFLDKNYGSWNTKDGKVVFSDKSALASYNDLLKPLGEDAKQIGDMQKQLVQ